MQSQFADIFYYVNDVTKMKEFYSDILGWEETSFGDTEQYGYLTYAITESTNLVIMRANEKLEISNEWSMGPTFPSGTNYKFNWTVRFSSLEGYKKAVDKIIKQDISHFEDKPTWVGNYWSFHVHDPMGRTVDVYYEPEEEPEVTVWYQ